MIPGVVMGALLVWGGVAALVGISLQTGLAVALCIIGLGLIVGAVFGGSWILLIPAAFVAAGLMVTSVVDVPTQAYTFVPGGNPNILFPAVKTASGLVGVWCVRGGVGAGLDAQ